MNKTLDNALMAAFEAGTKHGAGYPSTAAIPRGATRNAYRHWHRQWTGVPHEGPGEATEEALCILTGGQHTTACWQPRIGHMTIGREQDLGTRMGHPGGHYG